MSQPVITPRLNTRRRQAHRAALPQVCVQCGATDALTLDHILARALGGTNERSNLQLLCHRCNRAKGRLECAEVERRQRTESKLAKAAYFREQARQQRAKPTGPAKNYGGRAFSKR